MITKLWLALKKWALALMVIYVIGLTVGSLMHLGGIPSLGFTFDDKIYHFFAYFVFTILVYNYFKVIQIKWVILLSAVAVFCYGIILEVLQSVLTSYRMFDVYDAFANALGVICACVVLYIRTNRKLNLN